MMGATMSARFAWMRQRPDELVRITRFIVPSIHAKRNGRRRRRQLNVLSARSSRNSIWLNLLLRRLLAVGVALGIAGENLLGDQAGVLADRGLDLGGDVGVGLQERLGVLAALAEALAVIGEPRAGFLYDAGLDAEIEDLAHLGDALTVHDVELDLLEG